MVSVATKTKRKRKIVLGPKDQGRKMSLDDFDRAITPAPGLYELNKGVVEVSEVPHVGHAMVASEIRDMLTMHRMSHPGSINLIAGPSDAKVMSQRDQSERHPDLLVYLDRPPEGMNQPWSDWIPAIVVEAVSESSVKRDYEEKPPEYANIGIREYWIVDRFKGIVTVNTRWRGVWKPKVLKPGQVYDTSLLPGFKLDVRKILAAGK